MKLSDLKRFSLESQPHPTGRMSVSLFVLDDERVNDANQRSLSMINVTASGKDETDATKKGIDVCLSRLEKLQKHADIVKLGVLSLNQDNSGFQCTVQLGLFDKAESGADLIVKKTLGFGKGKTADKAEEAALESALELIGEK